MTWVPRELNAEADAITNGQVTWLNPALRIIAKMEDLPFVLLKELLSAGGELYKGLETVNIESGSLAKKPLGLLKVRDPWD